MEKLVKEGIPTKEGITRYPPDGFYGWSRLKKVACTCAIRCGSICTGRKCGCLACSFRNGVRDL